MRMSRLQPLRGGLVPMALGGCLAMAVLAGCDRPANDETIDPPTATDPGAPPVDPVVPDPDGAEDDANVSMRYSCEGGWNIAVSGDTAQVTTGDGRVIELQRVADRSPPLFAGGALEFSIDGDGAVLGQDEGGPFPCEEAG